VRTDEHVERRVSDRECLPNRQGPSTLQVRRERLAFEPLHDEEHRTTRALYISPNGDGRRVFDHARDVRFSAEPRANQLVAEVALVKELDGRAATAWKARFVDRGRRSNSKHAVEPPTAVEATANPALRRVEKVVDLVGIELDARPEFPSD
jgi:hypothetical protein